jgi:acetyl-CoA carboxylase carboxyl transferase subunit alpha
MKLTSVKRNHRGIARKATSSLPLLMRQVCDDFIELRRARFSFGRNRVIGGFARIGHYSVVILIYGENGYRGKSCTAGSVCGRADGFRKFQYLMQLAHKFSRPVVVYFADPTSSSGTAITELHEVLGLPKHLLSQWYLEVPIILVVLTSKSAYDIFGIWLADKTIALEQARFMMTLPDRGKNHRIIVSTEELVRGGVIDKAIPAPSNPARHSQALMSYRLRGALTRMLDEVSHVSPRDLSLRRQAKFARVEAIAVDLCGRGK